MMDDDLLGQVSNQHDLNQGIMRQILEIESDCLDLDVTTDEAVERIEELVREEASV